jgi:hypothetical protein
MDSGVPTEEIEGRPGSGSTDWETVAPSDPTAATERLPAVPGVTADAAEAQQQRPGMEAPHDGGTTQVHSPLVTTRRDQCASCGSPLASDQRYCVECGERRGRARVPQLDGIAERNHAASAAGSSHRGSRLSVNNTLLAIIGTLLLAMGVGVLIGRTSNGSSSKAPPVRVVTVAGTGAAATEGTAAAQGSGSSSGSGGKAGGPGAHAAAKTPPKHTKVPLKVVTVGSPGKGPGYQHGHFTGNFFGPESEEKK